MLRLQLTLSLLGMLLVSRAHCEPVTVQRLDGSNINVILDRPPAGRRIPILLAIDGSTCSPSRFSPWIDWLRSQQAGATPYAVVVVEKPGISAEPISRDSLKSGDLRCTDEFKKYYTLDRRVLDHLKAVAQLRMHADWWDGRLFIWGFSDGAHIAARIGPLIPETQGAVLIGFGGGTSMSQQFESTMCGGRRDRIECLSTLRAQLHEIRANPIPSKSWLGDSNTYAVWASRMDAIYTNVIRDAPFSILLIHGTNDSSIPVSAARTLVKALASPRGSIVYREIEGMGHGLGDGLPSDRVVPLYQSSLKWLFAAARK